MSTYAVRYSAPLWGIQSGAFVPVVGASVIVRRNGVPTPIYADRAKTALSPVGVVPTGVASGAVGLDASGNLIFWTDAGSDLDYVVTVAGTSVTVPVPTLSADLAEPLPAAAVTEAMLAFGVATQAELDAAIAGVSIADATTTTKGKLQLAGDLAGTAAAPTVPGLALKANDADVVHDTGNESVAGVKDFTTDNGLKYKGQVVVRVNEQALSLLDPRVTPNPGSVTDWGPQLTAAKTLLGAGTPNFDPRGGGKIFVPPGLYPISTPFDFDNNIEVEGAGPSTLFLCKANIEMFRVTATDAFGKRGFALRKCKLMVDSGFASATAFASHAFGSASGGFSYATLQDLDIVKTGGGTPIYGSWMRGLDLDFFIECVIDNVTIVGTSATEGIRLKNASNATKLQARIRECGTGIEVDGNSLAFMADSTIEGCVTYGAHVTNGALRMSRMHFENAPGSVDLYVVAGQSGSLANSEIVTINLAGTTPNTINDWGFSDNAVRGRVQVGAGCLNTNFKNSGGPTTADDAGVDTIIIGNRASDAPNGGTRSTTEIRGEFRVGHSTTALRPAATSMRKGALWFDDTLNKLIWSDGSAWIEAGAGGGSFVDLSTNQTIAGNKTFTGQIKTANNELVIKAAASWDPMFTIASAAGGQSNTYGASITGGVVGLQLAAEAAGIPLEVRGQTGQTGDLIVAKTQAGAPLFQVRANGALVGFSAATGSRPTPSAAGTGAQMFDTTLNKPIWSDGTNWRDAAGTIV